MSTSTTETAKAAAQATTAAMPSFECGFAVFSQLTDVSDFSLLLWKPADRIATPAAFRHCRIDAAVARALDFDTKSIKGDEGLAWTPDNRLVFSLGPLGADNISIFDRNGIRPLAVDANGNRQPAAGGEFIVCASNYRVFVHSVQIPQNRRLSLTSFRIRIILNLT